MIENPESELFTESAIKANFSALLYVLTEQQALIGNLLQVLLESGLITTQQLRKITDLEEGEEGLTPTYTQLYNRFASYYLRTKYVLDTDEAIGNVIDRVLEDKDKGKPEKEKDDE